LRVGYRRADCACTTEGPFREGIGWNGLWLRRQQGGRPARWRRIRIRCWWLAPFVHVGFEENLYGTEPLCSIRALDLEKNDERKSSGCAQTAADQRSSRAIDRGMADHSCRSPRMARVALAGDSVGKQCGCGNIDLYVTKKTRHAQAKPMWMANKQDARRHKNLIKVRIYLPGK